MPPTIVEIVKKGLCLGCGMCELACPHGAISMTYDNIRGIHQPVISSEKCTNCNLCQEVCFAVHCRIWLNKGIDTWAAVLGKCVSCYTGFATDHDLRFKAASGGIVTALLIFLLEEGYVDGAIVTRIEPKGEPGPPIAKAFIAKSKDELISATGSKYCPVILTDAFKALERGKHYVFVGLPCQIYAAKKLAEINKRFKNCIKLYIGLFCGGTFSYNAIEYLLRKYGLEARTVTRLEYRGGGWPGRMFIQTDSSSIVIPFPEYWPLLSPWFYLNTCMTCIEGFNPQADISCGDAWIPAIMSKDKVGTSIVVSRTKIGDELIKKAEMRRYIVLQKVDVKTILNAQKSMLTFKHLRINERLHILSTLHKEYIGGGVKFMRMKARTRIYLGELSILLGRFLASREKLWPIFDLYRILLKSFLTFLMQLKALKANVTRRLKHPLQLS